MTPARWHVTTPSRFPWEQDAFNFIREGLPDRDPYRAWQGFEFIADDGSVNEVDLLVLTPRGLFLVEAKGRPGVISGDAGTWVWRDGGHEHTVENPLFAANAKAKKLRSLLDRQRAAKRASVRIPFIEALIFCSAPGVELKLQGHAATRVCLRDVPSMEGEAPRPGILAALERRECPGLDRHSRGDVNREVAKLLEQALAQAGVRPTNRSRRVKDYLLEAVLMEGPGFQDWQAVHSRLRDTRRRVRLYLSPPEAGDESRAVLDRAALREFQLLETLEHPGILRALELTEHEIGPALVFEHDSRCMRLDHFLRESGDRLSAVDRLDLLRQAADAIAYAHRKKVVHRALGPQSILVHPGSRTTNGKPAAKNPRIKVFNWQVGFRGSGSSTGVAPISATTHVGQLVEDASRAYMAPEALLPSDDAAEYLDVFSLGAIAYFLFSGKAPAANAVELNDRLQGTQGLQVSAVLNGVSPELQDLIRESTHPQVALRLGSVAEFLERLDRVERTLKTPAEETADDPAEAKPGDRLEGGFVVKRRLGTGATSTALLVEHDVERGGTEYVLKVATTPDHNETIGAEGEVLRKLRHQLVAEYAATLEISGRTCLLMAPAGKETLRDRLRQEGALGVELLERFGEDLLQVVAFLEERGVPHRDIKPDNLAVGEAGGGKRLHLVLFDFSLSRTPAENIQAGTQGYLDPFLRLRSPRRWDLHAERYAAAATLHELATGRLPRWGDGRSDPSQLDCEATIDAESFDADLRESLTAFFAKALRRDPSARFDNAEEMQRAWRRVFEGMKAPVPITDHASEASLEALLEGATLDTSVHELPLGTRALNTLDRVNVLTAGQLLRFPLAGLLRLRGVGNKTRREISSVVKVLRQTVRAPEAQVTAADSGPAGAAAVDAAAAIPGAHEAVASTLDALVPQLLPIGRRQGEEDAARVLRAFLGLDPLPSSSWPSQVDVAEHSGVPRARTHHVVTQAVERWKKLPSLTRLRAEIDDILATSGGVLTGLELRDAVLVARGSEAEELIRPRLALAATRAAVEVERDMAEPRYIVRRSGGRAIIARSEDLAAYALRLGAEAERLAGEDPLVPPARTVERLRSIKPPADVEPLSDPRLVRLAAAASGTAALSTRQEMYPRGLEARRALKLALASLPLNVELTVEEIRERVASRYPEAEPLPGRPHLDGLLRDAGRELEWNAAGAGGKGAYKPERQEDALVSTGTTKTDRLATMPGPQRPLDVTPEVAAARQFEERLERALREGAFLALTVDPWMYIQAREEIARRFEGRIRDVDLEAVFLERLREAADAVGARWEVVLKADAKKGNGDWPKLLALVRRAMPRVEEEILASGQTVLLAFPNILGRYEQMDLLERLRDRVARGASGGTSSLPGLWLLIAADDQQEMPVMDGKVVPVISPGQRARIPRSWIRNEHRATPAPEGVPS